jgi:DNA polymerase-3 subunit beta
MEIRVNKNELLKGIRIVIKGVGKTSTLPILKGIKIEAKANQLELEATDLELTIHTKVSCDVLEEGACVMNGKMLNDIISKLPDGEVTLKVENNRALITSLGSEFNILTENAIEFPTPPTINEGLEVEIGKDALQEGIKKVVIATADEEIRPVLTGSKMEIDNGTLVLVALDGYRLAYKKATVDYKGEVSAIIPKVALNEISRLTEGVETVKVALGDNLASFQIGDTRVSTRLLEGEFVNYKQIIKDSYKLKVKVNTKELLDAVERATLLAKEGKNNLVKFDIKDGNFVLTSKADIGEVKEGIKILEQDGDIELKIGFNAKFLIDGLKSITDPEVYLYFENSVTPAIIREVSNEDNYLYLVLPVRIKE